MSPTVSCLSVYGNTQLIGASRHLYHDTLEGIGKGVSFSQDACRAYDDDHLVYRPDLADVQ